MRENGKCNDCPDYTYKMNSNICRGDSCLSNQIITIGGKCQTCQPYTRRIDEYKCGEDTCNNN